ncbi:DNA polymerase III subunit delta [Candidatus Falkowbacteria bacterium]|nr:DNA polymerase III subunit delta [Candidatus Falkowbacteria bacterium]
MVLFLYGEDSYRSRAKLKQIEERFKKTDKSRVNFIRIDGERNPWKNIEKEILSPPFLHDKKLVVVENFLKKRGQKFDEAVAFLKEEKIPAGTVVVFWDDSKPDERTAIFKFLAKPKQADKFDLLDAAKLKKWIAEAAAEREIKIEPRAVEMMLGLVGFDLWQMSGELDKLAAYVRGQKEKNNLVTAEDVAIFVKGKFDENIFSLTDALGTKNKKIIFKILNEQIEAGLEEGYIFAMLVRQFRILLQIKELVAKEYSFISASDPGIKQKIAMELGLHPYVVQKTLYQVKNFSLPELKKIYGKLLAIDMKMKRGNFNPRAFLDLFVAEVCLE